jgi:hypothetical protein
MLTAEAQAVIGKPERQRTVEEQKIADDYFPILRIDGDKLTEAMPEEARKKYQELQRKLNENGPGNNGRQEPSLPVFYTVEVDRLREQEKSYDLTSGDPLRPEKDHEVKPGWPFITSEPDFREGRIEAFADWLTAPENPLLARVAVNRLWQWHLGRGLRESTRDFGDAVASGPAGLACLGVRAARFQHEANAPADGDVRRLQAGIGSGRRICGESIAGPGRHRALAFSIAACGSGANLGFDARSGQ